MKTIAFKGHHEINGHLYHHGEELPPGVLSQEVVNQWIDKGRLIEYDSAERRSLYQLFSTFSGAKEQEQLTRQELTAYTLPA
jgi:hypothetical protein